MSLAPGTQLGPYQILALLGKGGMGEVWRARDTKLGREVAIKSLPAEFAQDRERRARFEQEARALATLNHSNVGAIYGLEERDGAAFLVLELIDGPTLADEVARGPLPLDRAIAIAAQIAEGLEAAHEAGIIHRDLKPANIKLTRSGGSLDPPSVKILDFGLARTLGADTSGPEMLKSTIMAPTLPGMIVGTVAYMSPEQARGEVVDKRTDVFAFGCVLYECLTGRQAFGGPTMTDALAATMKSDPDWSLLPMNLPQSIGDLLRRCLRKNPRQRLQSIGDARVILQEPRSPAPVAALPHATTLIAKRPVGLWITAVLIGGLVAGALVGRLTRGPAPAATAVSSTVRAMLPLPAGLSLSFNILPTIAISPDGTTVVFRGSQAGVSRLYRRPLAGGESEPIVGSEGNAGDPFFSPDGQWLAFFAQGRLKKVSMAGGAPVVICEVPPVASGGTWTSDGWIVFSRAPNLSLSRVSPAGGAVEDWSTLDAARGEHAHIWPQALPEGRMLVTMVFGHDFQDLNESKAVILTPGEKPRDIQEGSAFARIVPGWLVFVRGDTVLAAPFDGKTFTVTGPAIRVSDSIAISVGRRTPQFAVSTEGTLLSVSGPSPTAPIGDVVRVDAKGQPTMLGLDAGIYGEVRLSPDAKRLALVRVDGGMAQRLFVFDIERHVLSPLTPEPGRSLVPVWSPDGKRIAYGHFELTNPRLYVKNADGSEAATALTEPTEDAEFPNSWSPDGNVLAYTRNYTVGASETRRRGTSDIWLLPMDRSAPPHPWFESPNNQFGAAFSPDGRFLAYVSDESGRLEVYVRPYPGPGGKIQVSNQGGNEAAWSANGRAILYREGSRFMSAAFTTTPEPAVLAPRELFSAAFDRTGREDSPREYDVSRDGSLMVALQTRPREPLVHQLSVVTNWTGSLGKGK